MKRSLTCIVSDCKIPPLFIFLTIFKHMCLTTLNDEYNPPMKAVQLMVSNVVMFH